LSGSAESQPEYPASPVRRTTVLRSPLLVQASFDFENRQMVSPPPLAKNSIDPKRFLSNDFVANETENRLGVSESGPVKARAQFFSGKLFRSAKPHDLSTLIGARSSSVLTSHSLSPLLSLSHNN
jgi:hypothetical protein